jgi:sugar lactone lactonase YvrE
MHCFFSRTIPYCACVLLLSLKAFPLSNFTNYQSVIRINDILVSGNKVWAASSGGLLLIDLENRTQSLFSDNYSFPDQNLTALSMDSKGNLWIGSNSGYLYQRTPGGRYTVFDSYYGSQWGIQDVFAYKNYIIVGSSKGCGVFDPIRGISVRNSTAFDTSANPYNSVNAITVHKDSLYVGCNGSYDAFDISGTKIFTSNLLDMALWNAVYTASPIVSFTDSSGTLAPQNSPSVFVGKTLFHCDSNVDSVSSLTADSLAVFVPATSVLAGAAPAFKVPGIITTMTADEKNNVWVGTDQNFLYCWNGTTLSHYTVEGLTFNFVARVYAAKNGTVWMLPQASTTTSSELWKPLWWEGITSFNGIRWRLYSRFSVAGLGEFGGGGPDFRGICEDRSGNMWFGTSGANVKMYNSAKNTWSRFYFAGYDMDLVTQYPPEGAHWGKHNAIAQDSSGYLWVANFSNENLITNGCLVCYDLTNTNSPNYRRFFPNEDKQNSIWNIYSLCVDTRGKIIVGGYNGRLLVLSHDGHPLQDGVTVDFNNSDVGAVVWEMCATSGGNTWISAGSGVYKYNSVTNSISRISTIQTAVTSIAAETDSILWLGTSGSGLLRYDTGKDSVKTIDMVNGLVSNTVNDITIDKSKGILWVATSGGLSRYNLGHSSTPVAGNASIIAYPNPFSMSNPNHREIVFKHCFAGAKVFIYAMNGSLVKQLSPGNDNAFSSDENPFETTLHWIPSKKMSPGTYYFVGQPQKPVKTKKLLIIP